MAAPDAPQPQFVEEPGIYPFTFTLTGNQAVQDIPVVIDRDSDFLLTGIWGSSTGLYTLNFALPSGRKICSSQILNTNIIGTANQPTPIGPPPIYRAGSKGPAVDLTDITGAGNSVTIYFGGLRRLRTA